MRRMRGGRVLGGCLLLGLGLGCQRPQAGPTLEFQEAMRLYEDTVSRTLDPTYQHPDFQAVAAKLATVPATHEREHRTAQRLLESIRAAQEDARAREASLEAARKQGEAKAAELMRSSDGYPGALPARAGVPYRDQPSAPASGRPDRPGFDRAADRARLSNAIRDRKDAIKRHNEREAEVRAKMQQRLGEKVEERMNTPLDEGHWKLDESRGVLRTRVEVKREEVE